MQAMLKMTLLCERISFQKLLHEFFEESGFIFNGELDSIVCRMCGFKTKGTLHIDHIQFMHVLYNQECEMISYKPENYKNFAKAKVCVNNYPFAKEFVRENEELMLFTFNSWQNYKSFAKAKLCINNYPFAKKFVRETEELMLFTFNSWPKQLPNIEQLVAAGFYYTGVSDEVTCIECNVLVYDWEIGDDPMIEHEKASPKCLLVKLQKANL